MILEVSKEHRGVRVDVFIQSQIKDLSRTRVKKIIIEGCVKINDETIDLPSKRIKENDKVKIKIPLAKESKILPQKIKIDILYDDDDIVIINKRPGLVMHPGAGNHDKTLVNALLHIYKNKLSGVGGKLRPGIVHRIDKDTSGVIVVAKNDHAHINLSKQFSDHTIIRKYEALVWGSLRPQSGKIIMPISRSKKNRQLMSINKFYKKKAITNYKTLKIYENKNVPKISLIECQLETGRTHQIRVHMSFKGNPVLGDQNYGKNKRKFKNIDKKLEKIIKNFNRQALHAKSLEFLHPRTNNNIFFEASRPKDLEELIKTLKKSSF